MIIVGDGSSNIENVDSLAAPARRQYDKRITNIPFNLSGVYPGHLYDSAQKNGKVVYLLHCLHAVRVVERACIIVPENFCYDSAYAEARREILGLARLAALIRLLRATFKSYTTACTCILLFDDIARDKITRASRYAFVEIEKDGFSDSVWREPIDDNDIGAVLESGPEFAGYAKMSPAADYALFAAGAGASFMAAGFFYLKDVLTLKEPSALQPDVLYSEPKLCSHTNTVRRRGGGRMGRNIKGGGRKVIIEPGDLIIVTLHTNSGNGLFAVSDDVYVAISQIVGRIREDLIDRDFLLHTLRRVLPQLQVNDLVGRVTFKKADILDVKIPKPPAFLPAASIKNCAMNGGAPPPLLRRGWARRWTRFLAARFLAFFFGPIVLRACKIWRLPAWILWRLILNQRK